MFDYSETIQVNSATKQTGFPLDTTDIIHLEATGKRCFNICSWLVERINKPFIQNHMICAIFEFWCFAKAGKHMMWQQYLRVKKSKNKAKKRQV